MSRHGALTLSVRPHQEAGSFCADVSWNGVQAAVGASYPAVSGAGREEELRDGLTLAFAAVAAQACLADQVFVCNRELPHGSEEVLKSLLDILYGAHAYSQTVAVWPEPEVSLETGGPRPGSSELAEAREATSSVLLWSGGKDALAALLVLRANRFEVTGLHVTANTTVVDHERGAASHLAEAMHLYVLEADVTWDGITQLIAESTRTPVAFPGVNAIPFGRDLVLAVLAVTAFPNDRQGWVALGLENELLTKQVQHAGKVVFRHDVQSHQGLVALSSMLELTTGSAAFSPIGGLTELTVLRYLLTTLPDAWQHINSCFWGRWCGECPKCVRYFLAEALTGTACIAFRRSPLAGAADAVRTLATRVNDPTLPFWEMQVLGLYALCDQGLLRAHPTIVEILNAHRDGFDAKRHQMQRYVDATHGVLGGPAGFKTTLPPAPRVNFSPALKGHGYDDHSS